MVSATLMCLSLFLPYENKGGCGPKSMSGTRGIATQASGPTAFVMAGNAACTLLNRSALKCTRMQCAFLWAIGVNHVCAILVRRINDAIIPMYKAVSERRLK